MEHEKIDGQTVEVRGTQEHHEQTKKKTHFKMPPRKTLYVVGVVVILAVVGFLARSYFVAAMVNGSFISKASYIREMERQSGQEVLDSLIINKLVENKVKEIEVSNEELDVELKTTEDNLEAQGTSLTDALASANISEKEYRNRVTTQLKLKKLVADKTTVTEDEITKYLTANRAQLPKGLDQKTLRDQAAESIEQTKFSQEVGTLIDTLKAEADIRYFVKF